MGAVASQGCDSPWEYLEFGEELLLGVSPVEQEEQGAGGKAGLGLLSLCCVSQLKVMQQIDLRIVALACLHIYKKSENVHPQQ